MDAQRKAQTPDPVYYPFVEVDELWPPFPGFPRRQRLDEVLLAGDGLVTGILDQPVDESDLDSSFGTKPKESKTSGR